MNRLTSQKWIVDLNELSCFNIENQMLIVFVKKGPTFQGKIKEMPVELQEMSKKTKNGEKYIRNAVIEADAVFFKAYFEREIEEKCRQGG